MRKRSRKRRVSTGKRRSPVRRRRARRNPWPVGGLVAAANPKRRRRSRVHRVGRKRSRRRGYRRNPASLSLMGFRVPPINQIIFAGVGFIAPPMVEGFISGFLPASMQPSPDNKVATYAIRIASVVGLTFAVGKFVGRDEARMTAIGGSVYIASQAIKDFAPSLATQIGLNAYVPSTGGFGEYVPTNRQLSDGFNVRPFTNNAIDAAVPSRFKRF